MNTSTTAFWVLRQNYCEKTNQSQIKEMIMRQHIITCPWGGWGSARENVINGIYNETRPDGSGRPSGGQDRKFVENMKIGDIVLICISKQGYIVGRIVSGVEYAIDTGLFWTEKDTQIVLGETGDLPFRPVGRYIEIITTEFEPKRRLGQKTISKMNKIIVDMLKPLL
jgi:hypothetical protein